MNQGFHSRGMQLYLQRSFIASSIIAYCFLIACDEPEQTTSPRRPVVQRSKVVQTSSNTVDLSKYNRMGNGPLKAPDWIASQDLSLMRRYSLNAPAGFRNGVEFKPQGVWIERREAGWVLVLNEVALAYPEELILKGQRVEIPFEGEPNSQFQLQRTTEESKASWRIPAAPIQGKTKVWNTKSEYSVELLQWSVAPYDPKKGVFQAAGKATGRLMIQFIDQQGVQGWIVGKFEDIMIRYMGDPNRW